MSGRGAKAVSSVVPSVSKACFTRLDQACVGIGPKISHVGL